LVVGSVTARQGLVHSPKGLENRPPIR
jgi:hypothetical protein